MYFQRESLTPELFGEMVPLLPSHWAEIAAFPEALPKPEMGFYAQVEEAGGLRVFTARLAEKLVGYAVFFVSPNPHSSEETVAEADLLYLAPSARQGLHGYRFLQFCDSELKKEGVHQVVHSVSERRDFSSLLNRLGYRPIERVFARRLHE